MMSKFYFKLLFFLIITISACRFQTSENSQKTDTIIKHSYTIISDTNQYYLEPAELPVWYVGIPNILKYSENLKDSVIIDVQDGNVRLFSKYNHCEIIPHKVGNKKIIVYKKINTTDSVKVFEKLFRVRALPNPVIAISRHEEMSRRQFLSISKLRCYIENLPIEIHCKIKSFTIVAYINNKEVEIESNDEYLNQKQIKLLSQVEAQHIIFKNIITELPDGKLRKIPNFAIKLNAE